MQGSFLLAPKDISRALILEAIEDTQHAQEDPEVPSEVTKEDSPCTFFFEPPGFRGVQKAAVTTNVVPEAKIDAAAESGYKASDVEVKSSRSVKKVDKRESKNKSDGKFQKRAVDKDSVKSKSKKSKA